MPGREKNRTQQPVAPADECRQRVEDLLAGLPDCVIIPVPDDPETILTLIGDPRAEPAPKH